MRPLLLWLLCLACVAPAAPLAPGDDLQAAINRAGPGSLIELGPGRFELSATLVIPTRSHLRGCGMGITTLARVGSYRYTMLQNEQSGGEWITVEDLTIDCADTCFLGLCLWGSHNTARNVQVCNHISPMLPDPTKGRQESFAILLTTSGATPIRDCLAEGCIVSDFHGNYDGGIVIASGTATPVEGTIRNCRYFGNKTAEAFDFVGVFGASVVEGCWMEDVAVGIYTEGGFGSMTIRNNTFRRVRGAAIKLNLEQPQISMIVHGNCIDLAGGSAIASAANANRIGRLDFQANILSGTEPRFDLPEGTWKRRKLEKAPRTVVGPVTLDGDWKKALR